MVEILWPGPERLVVNGQPTAQGADSFDGTAALPTWYQVLVIGVCRGTGRNGDGIRPKLVKCAELEMELPSAFLCNVRRISAHKISIFVPRPRDAAHPGSGSAQSLLRIRSSWLTLTHPNYRFRQATPQHAQLLQL